MLCCHWPRLCWVDAAVMALPRPTPRDPGCRRQRTIGQNPCPAPPVAAPRCVCVPQVWPFAAPGRGIDGHASLAPEQYQYSMEHWIAQVRPPQLPAARQDSCCAFLSAAHLALLRATASSSRLPSSCAAGNAVEGARGSPLRPLPPLNTPCLEFTAGCRPPLLLPLLPACLPAVHPQQQPLHHRPVDRRLCVCRHALLPRRLDGLAAPQQRGGAWPRGAAQPGELDQARHRAPADHAQVGTRLGWWVRGWGLGAGGAGVCGVA